ncbi:MAG: hypothetical protein ISN29_04915 [Gammaproteobacteria bacterium AqS3]|nr:hypothetical protein [Gammaproteobacteria bacterium AqS3]
MKPHKARLILERVDEVDEGLDFVDLADRIKLFGQLLAESAKRAGCENVRCQVTHVSHSSPLGVECAVKFDRPSKQQMDPFRSLQSALEVLPKGNIRDYQDKDRKYLEKVQKLMRHKGKKMGGVEVQLHSENRKKPKTYKSIDMPQPAGEKTRRKTRKVYDIVKGELKVVDLRDGKSKCMVIPVFPGIPKVECEFSDEMFEDIQNNLGQMVAVHGECWSYVGQAFPHRMRVSRIKRIPAPDKDTTLYDIQGICPELGGDKPAEQIVREMRDEWDD